MGAQSRAGIGCSCLPETRKAIEQAVGQALNELGSLSPVCAIAYGTVLYNQQEIAQVLKALLPEIPIVGGSTQGISLLNDVKEVDRVFGIAIIGSEKIRVRAACVHEIAKDPVAAGLHLAKTLGTTTEEKCPLLLWYDPLTGVNTDSLLLGLAEGGRPSVVGGATGQPFGLVHKTYQYFDGHAFNDSAVGLQFENACIPFGLTHGTEPLGLEHTITKAEQNIIKELDGRPALDVWAEQLGFEEGELTEFNVIDAAAWAVGVTLPPEIAKHYEGPVTRAVFGINVENREIILQAPLSSGIQVQVCHRTPHAVMGRALEMANRLKEQLLHKLPVLALSFECGARPRPFLGDEQALAEVAQIQAILGGNIPWLGFYAWGEIAPIRGQSYFHNYTFPLCVICEKTDFEPRSTSVRDR